MLAQFRTTRALSRFALVADGFPNAYSGSVLCSVQAAEQHWLSLIEAQQAIHDAPVRLDVLSGDLDE